MLENPRPSTIKLKNASKQKVSYLPSHFGLDLEKEFKFSKTFFFIFIDLGQKVIKFISQLEVINKR